MPNYTAGSTRIALMQPDLTTLQTSGTVVLDSRRTRPLWFDGRFLAARDLEREQNYFLQRQADLGQAAGFATLNGLLVQQGAATGTVVIQAGEGVTPAGEMVQVPSDLTVQLSALATANSSQKLTGLFVLTLQPVEYAANPITAYPTTVQGPRSTHLGDMVEATVVGLLPYPNPPAASDPTTLRSALARQAFLTGNPASLPDSVLPLAVINVQSGAVAWIDAYLVRRDLGPQFSGVRFGLTDPAAQQAFLQQFDTQLQAVVEARQNSGMKANFAASAYFQTLPPVGRFPLDAIDTGAFSQVFFPQQMDVRLSVVPDDEWPALIDDGLSLPPIDLQLPDSAYANMSVLALIPVPVATLAALKASLPDTPLNPILPQVLANRSPIQLLRLYQGSITVTPPTPVANSAWASAVGSLQYGYYLRRRSTPTVVEFKTPSGITLVSSENPAVFGTNLTFSAMIAPGSATGSVEFFDGPTALGTVNVSGGTAAFSTAALVVGAHPITAVYGGDSTNVGSTSAVLNQSVTKVPAVVTVTSSLNPSTLAQAVTFTASVTPTGATGNVEFFDGSTSLGKAALGGGIVPFATTSTLSAGTHSITAVYAGDANNGGASSPALTQTVNKLATSVTVSASLNPAVFGQAVTLSATVAPVAATGSVQFFDAGKSLGTAALNSGVATLPAIATLVAGTHPITAAYSGDGNDSTSTSTTFVLTISKVATTTTLVSSPDPSTFGQAVTLTATVTPAAATGFVQFLDAGKSLGTATVTSGKATLATSALAVGAHTLTAVYAGDANNATSTSAVVTQTVNKIATSVTVATSGSPATFGQSVTFTATVTPATATGSVQFLDGSNVLGTGTVSGGVATLATAALTVGNHAIEASYGGDANDAAATSLVINQVITAVASNTALTSAPNPSTFGQAVTLRVQITPASATGTVQFTDGTTTLGSAAVSGGAATLSVSTLAVGSHSIEGTYSGDASNASSPSNLVTQIVNQAATSVAVASSANPSSFAQAIIFSAKVTPASATGNVTLTFAGSSALSAVLSGGTATFANVSPAAGTYIAIANYAGDVNNAASTSPPFTQTVNQTASSVTVATSNSQSLFGQAVTFTATVVPTFATGSVQFMDGPTSLGSVAIAGGVAKLTTSTLAVATHTITAIYSGDVNDTGATSAPIQQFVLKAAITTTVTASVNPLTIGQTVTLTATVVPASATGSVQFLDGANVLGSVALNAGSAAIPVSNFAAATHSITAVYSGDANNNGSTSAALALTVNKAGASLTLSSSVNPSQIAQSVTFTAKISIASATGTVQFLDSTASLGTATVSAGSASITTAALAAGTHTIIAQYSGDTNTGTATATLVQTVSRTTTSVVVTSSVNPAVNITTFTLTAKVTPANVTGSIQFEDSGKPIGSVVQITGGAAAIVCNNPTGAPPLLAVGAHSVTGVYSGDTNNLPATSPIFTQTVTAQIILTTPVLETTVKPIVGLQNVIDPIKEEPQ